MANCLACLRLAPRALRPTSRPALAFSPFSAASTRQSSPCRPSLLTRSVHKKSRAAVSDEFEEDHIEQDFDDSPAPSSAALGHSNADLLALLDQSRFHLKSFHPSTKALRRLINSTGSDASVAPADALDRTLAVLQLWRQKGADVTPVTGETFVQKAIELECPERAIELYRRRDLYGLDLTSVSVANDIMLALEERLRNPSTEEDKAAALVAIQDLKELVQHYIPTQAADPGLLLYTLKATARAGALDRDALLKFNAIGLTTAAAWKAALKETMVAPTTLALRYTTQQLESEGNDDAVKFTTLARRLLSDA